MKTTLTILAVSAVLLMTPLPGLAQGSEAEAAITPAERDILQPSGALLETGRDVANSACAACHGLDGVNGGPGIPHLAGQRAVYLHRVLQAYQTRERHSDDMNHAIGYLSEQALLAVSAYYASLTPARPQAPEAAPTALAEAGAGDPFADIRQAMGKCVKCHGDDGNATASGMPNLTAQDPAYFMYAVNAYGRGERSHRLMEKLVGELDEQTLSSMGVYYAVQEPKRTSTAGDGNADLGRSLAQQCASCHGDDGNAGGAEMPTLAGQDARYFIKAVQAYKEGKRPAGMMFELIDGLSEADVKNLAAFYARQEPIRRNVRTPLTTAEWISRCERCHGIDGNSTDPRFPMLAGQNRSYLVNALTAYEETTTRTNSLMHAMSGTLGRADINRIADHYSSSEPKAVVYMQLPCEEEVEE